MKGFNFEKNLPQQETAVASALAVFDGLEAQPLLPKVNENQVNPRYNKVEKIGNSYSHGMKPFGQYLNKHQIV